MSKLDELIESLCPNGVEYLKLNEVCSVNTGTQLNKSKLLESGEYPVINGGINPSGYWNEFNAEKNTITISQGGASAGYVNYMEVPFWAGAHCYVVTKESEKINYKFLYHFLKSKQKILQQCQQGAGIPGLSRKAIYELATPVPPLEVQCEIVHILDDFTLLSAELSAELKARQKQYEYYRDELIKLENLPNAKMMKLKEIATEFYRGNGIKREEVTETGIPCVRYGEIYTTYNIWFDKCKSYTTEDKIKNKKYFENGDILFAITGESIEEIAKSIVYLGKERCLAGGDIVVMKHSQNPKYLSYALSTNNAIMQKGKGKVKSKVVHSNVPSIQEIEIPIPSLEKQQEIADKLDRFYNLLNNIKEGLPAEIEARQKQYEYYRDKLLNFKELKVEE